MVSDRVGENEGRGRKEKACGGSGWGGGVLKKEMWWEEAWAGRLGGKKEDLMNVDHCPST